MGDLLLRLSGSYGIADVVARFSDHTTVGQLADEIEVRLDRSGDTPRTLQRQSRGSAYFARSARLSQIDLRSGDLVCLALDTGLRASHHVQAAASLRVVSGPDAGRTFELRRGESTIGRSSRCDVALRDEMASRRHAIIRVSDIVEVADAGSTNGVLVNDALITGVCRLRPGDRLLIGDTTLMADLLGGRHEAVDVVENAVEFNRPPRIDGPFTPITITLPAPVDPPPRRRLPMITALVPLIMGGVMYYLTRNIMTIAFMGLSPLMVFGSYWENRRSGHAAHRDRLTEFAAIMSDRRESLEQARDEEIRTRYRFAPGNDELLGFVGDLSPRLWEREPEDDDFLHLRVGVREQPSHVTVELGNGGSRDQRREQERIAEEYQILPPVPVVIDGRGRSPLAVAGPAAVADGITRSLLAQAATLHSPYELAVGALLGDDVAPDWDWLKWLPHTRGTSVLPYPPISVGVDDAITLLAALNEVIEQRLGNDSAHRGGEPVRHLPHFLLLVDGSLGIERPRFTRLLEDGARAGISVLWLANDARRVPNASKTVIQIEPGEATVSVGDSFAGGHTGGIPIEVMTQESAELLARSLAPIIDISASASGSAELPRTVGLIDLLGGLEVVESPAVVLERWHQAADGKALRAPVGRYEGGILSVDLRVDGPHGLVGGTTGAGKSEFLQAFIAGLAASHSPERINFLLVDYKGGSAFGELVDQFDGAGRLDWQGLHHTVGMITDLTPALVERALISLQAELHRREVLINRHRAKDLMEMESRHIPETPPSLLIVIDEFAALAKEVPAFVDGVVDIAQRGRSLGMHLLLATQKPGGVVTPNIQANTNLRVALRMATEDESNEVVNSPIAGRIDRTTPGRGVMRRGPSDLVAFQSAYVGGVTSPSTEAVLELGELGLSGVHWIGTPKQAAARPAEVESDLKRMVRTINTAARSLSLAPPRRPWLDPLPALVDLLALPRPVDDTRIPFGITDVPHHQTRGLAYFEPDQSGSILLFGMGGSGKTVALRSLAAAAGLANRAAPVHVYGLDFAGRGLEMIEPLPHVGDVIAGDDYERVTQLLKNIKAEIERRSQLFATARAATLGEYRHSAPAGGGADLPRILILLDGYDNFAATFERIDRGQWTELLPRLIADGRGAGIHFALTGTRRSSFPMALASLVSTRLVFKLAGSDDYHSLNAQPSWFDSSTPAGRCRMGDTEVQVGLLGGQASTALEAEQFQTLGRALAHSVAPAPAIQILPEQVHRAQLPPPSMGVGWLLTEDFTTVGPDLSQHVLIAGRARSGRTTALASLLAAVRETGLDPVAYAADPARCPFPAAGFEALAERLAVDPTGLIFIEGADRLAGSAAEYPLQQALGTGNLRVVVTADANVARSYDNTLKAIRARCDVLLLQPDPDVDSDLIGRPLPRVARRFPPGRGYARLLDTVAVVHTSS